MLIDSESLEFKELLEKLVNSAVSKKISELSKTVRWELRDLKQENEDLKEKIAVLENQVRILNELTEVEEKEVLADFEKTIPEQIRTLNERIDTADCRTIIPASFEKENIILTGKAGHAVYQILKFLVEKKPGTSGDKACTSKDFEEIVSTKVEKDYRPKTDNLRQAKKEAFLKAKKLFPSLKIIKISGGNRDSRLVMPKNFDMSILKRIEV